MRAFVKGDHKMEQVKVIRKPFGFNFEASVLDKFRSYCKDNQLNMSAVVQNLMEEYLEKTNKKEVLAEDSGI